MVSANVRISRRQLRQLAYNCYSICRRLRAGVTWTRDPEGEEDAELARLDLSRNRRHCPSEGVSVRWVTSECCSTES